MDLNFDNIYKKYNEIIKGNTIDLSKVQFVHPWTITMVCIWLIEKSRFHDKKLILPKNEKTKCYLKRMHLNNLLNELNYREASSELQSIIIPERDNLNIHEILHCNYRDEFNARLGRFIKIFQNYGLDLNDSYRATNVIGELGNNVFDHNSGNWPTNTVGCIIAAQRYPLHGRIEIAVADPGVGFWGSLKARFPNIKNDIEAIKLGLAGNTGRIGEVRGNGLKLIQQWTINNFSGKLMIHSGEGLVVVDKNGIKEYKVFRITGTIAQFVVNYKI